MHHLARVVRFQKAVSCSKLNLLFIICLLFCNPSPLLPTPSLQSFVLSFWLQLVLLPKTQKISRMPSPILEIIYGISVNQHLVPSPIAQTLQIMHHGYRMDLGLRSIEEKRPNGSGKPDLIKVINVGGWSRLNC